MTRQKKSQDLKFSGEELRTPVGMHDILPEVQGFWQRVREVVRKEAEDFGFLRIDTPILEKTFLFLKGVGEGTDIVEKEMYSFRTKGGENLTLRPEGTAPIVRAYLTQGMASWPLPVKLYYLGPFFRHDRPQKGRYRQFHQFGLEVIASASPASDVEVMRISYNILKKLGLEGFNFQVSSLGDPECRPQYEQTLRDFLTGMKASICRDCQEALEVRPLRIFDCKEEKCQRVARIAPKLLDNLCKACHKHFREVLETLDVLELPYDLNPQIVRGLDYYTRTVFEVWLKGEDSQRALGGGGRYDGLVELLGGKPTPAVGVAIGIERVISALQAQGKRFVKEKKPELFLAQLGQAPKRKAFGLFDDLREMGFSVRASFDRDSLKSQLRVADRLGVKIALILGQKELLEGKILVRDMSTGTQETVKLSNIKEVLKERLK